MTYEARVEKDSISPDGVRLTTFVITKPRIVLAEFNTHRVFTRSSASSRAVPVEKRLSMIESDPFIPEQFGKNQGGMSAAEMLEGAEAEAAHNEWVAACMDAVRHARKLAELGVHKQYANRVVEPYSWHTVVATATEWDNFLNLRDNKMAQPEIQRPARLMRELFRASKPVELGYGDWHLPFIYDEDYEQQILENPTDPLAVMRRLQDMSAGRCARVSYLNHEGKRVPQEDVDLTRKRLLPSGHMAPFEHPARVMTRDERELFKQPVVVWNGTGWDKTGEHTHFCGNFQGWVQMRKMIPGEAVWQGDGT